MNKPTKDEIESLYLRSRISPEQIARDFGVCGKTVRTWMEGYGIPRMGPSHLRKGVSAVWNIGIERTVEFRQKQSLTHLGNVPYNRGKGSRVFVCEVCGIEVTDKPYRRQRTCSKECKDQLSHIHRGTQHWNYQGESAGYVQRQRNWSQYREWRQAVLKQADFTCTRCKQRGGRLTAHHLSTWNNNPDARFDPANGACVCWKCHWAFHRQCGHHVTTPEMFSEWLTT